jgi:hypothetical protein
MVSMNTLTIRSATPADAVAIDRLAQLDSRAIPAAPQLVAESGGNLIAAISTRDGRAVADPFVRSADAVALLRRRAGQLRAEPKPRRRIALSGHGFRAVTR